MKLLPKSPRNCAMSGCFSYSRALPESSLHMAAEADRDAEEEGTAAVGSADRRSIDSLLVEAAAEEKRRQLLEY